MALKTMYPPQANSPATYLTEAVAADATSIKVNSASVLPALPTLLVLGSEEKVAECVLATSKSSNTITVERAVEGTAKAWPAGTSVARLFTAGDLKAVQDNIQLLSNEKISPDDVYYGEGDGSLWQRNTWRAADGHSSTHSKRCRTADFLPADIKAVIPSLGMKIDVFAWDSNGDYVGVWDGTTWSTDSDEIKWYQDKDVVRLSWFDPTYKIKLAAGYTDDRDISTLEEAQTAGALIKLYRYTDTHLNESGCPADAAAVGEALTIAEGRLDSLTDAAIEAIDTSAFGWEGGGPVTDGKQESTNTRRIRILNNLGKRGYFVRAGSTITVDTGYKFHVWMYSRYQSIYDFDLIGRRGFELGGGTYTIPQNCWIKVHIAALNDAVLWQSDESGNKTLTATGEAALASVSMSLLGTTAMQRIDALQEAVDSDVDMRTYPLEGGIPVNAIEYHKQWDDMVAAGFCTRSEAHYMSYDSEEHFPLYVYKIRKYKDHMEADNSGSYTRYNYDGTPETELYARPKVLLVAGLHGAEKSAPNFLFDFFNSIWRTPAFAELTAKFDWWVVPLANPWGYSHCFTSNNGEVYTGSSTTDAWYPTGYPNLTENTTENNYNEGIRYAPIFSNGEITRNVDPNRDFSDVPYGNPQRGFVLEETQFLRDNVLKQETFDIVIDMHNSGLAKTLNDTRLAFVSFAGTEASTEAQLKPLWRSVVQAGVATDVVMDSKYAMSNLTQHSFPWLAGNNATLRNYAAGVFADGHGYVDDPPGTNFAPAKYAMTMEMTQYGYPYSRSLVKHNDIANEYGNTFVRNFLLALLDTLSL